MQAIGRLARWFVIGVLVLWIGPKFCFTTVAPDEIGVRQSNFSGVQEDDLGPGWVMRVPGIHRVTMLPRRFEYLDYPKASAGGPPQPLQIRTQDRVTPVRARFEYRQSATGFKVFVKEVEVEARRGQVRFEVTGQEYRERGRLLGWRVVLTQGGHLLGERKSYLWD